MLHRLATAWIATGHHVSVLTSRSLDAPANEPPAPFPIVRSAVPRVRWLGTAWYVASLFCHIRRSGADVVYVSMLKHAAFAAVVALRGSSVPVVLRAEGSGPTGDAYWQRDAPFGAWIRRVCRQAAAIVVPSPVIAQELIDAGYPAPQLRLIPNGVPVPARPWQPEDVSDARRSLGLANVFTACYTGRLHVDKGLADLIEAAATLRRRGSAIQLVLLGEGPERTKLVERAHDTGVADLVHLPGRVSEVEPYLRASDFFVLPSYQEGLSVALLEAMALGMPAVASDIPANRFLDEKGTVILTPARDAAALAATVLRLRESPDAARAVGQSARALVQERFSLTAVAEQHVALFADVQRCHR